MKMETLLITGGAGFVGSNLACSFKAQNPNLKISVLDNLKRRGSELNLPRLKKMGIDFIHGDIRNPEDFQSLPKNFDLFIEASAEPSILTGLRPGESPWYALNTNLSGTMNCLEFARKHCEFFLFLSTSRVYSISALKKLPLEVTQNRFSLKIPADMPGLTSNGITEDFSTQGQRSLYGTTKLASELLVEEYAQSFGLKALINRCGVLCGPWQMGKVDQGVFTLWLMNHFFQKPLSYTGFGGKGHQVRDLLHPADLYDLVLAQLSKPGFWDGGAWNVGGGLENSVSLKELTQICQDLTNHKISLKENPETSAVDIPYYVTDISKVSSTFNWKPRVGIAEIFTQIHQWANTEELLLRQLF